MKPGPGSKRTSPQWPSSVDSIHQSATSPDANAVIRKLVGATVAAQRILLIWSGDAQSVRIGFDDLRLAFAEIIEARAAIECVPQAPPAALADALSQYRAALEVLKRHLPRVEGRLLAERSRLENRQTHMGAVENWVQAQDTWDRRPACPCRTKSGA